jgi:platelet-activating factor acetylhydrolase
LILKLSLLSTKPLKGFPTLPVDRTVLLDPWLEPLPTPGPTPLSKSSSFTEIAKAEEAAKLPLQETTFGPETQIQLATPRMLVINSEAFTVWEGHYERLREVVAGWEPQGGRILTLGKSSLSSPHSTLSFL